jgi:two-component system response regulator
MLIEKVVDVLLVEDSEEDAELAVAALKSRNLGDKVIRLVDGDEALEFLCASNWSSNWERENPPKLILLDLHLHRMGGLEVLQQLKVHDRTRPIPVVIFSSAADRKEIMECYRLGANSYVVKPADSKKFAQVVADIVHYWLHVNQSFHQQPASLSARKS